MIRQPIITVLGHVDHGKTKLLDAIRNSKVTEKEAGAITQHIGATEVPVETIREISGSLLERFGFELKIPGLLFIDTPGHEAFTNLRKRGGSIADLAILVVDVMQGLQPQTIEAIQILKTYKVPFVIAMNKIDMIQYYDSKPGSFLDNLKNQSPKTVTLLDEKLYVLVGKIYEQGFESERFDRCEFGKQIPIVPVSAETKEGLPEILTLLSGLSQKYLEKKLDISSEENGRAAVLEAKEEQGLGKTIDVILYKGSLKVNDKIAVAGKNGIIETKIRALLQPKPLQEIRMTKERFLSVKEVSAATGVKVVAPCLDHVLAGATLAVIKTGDEIKELEDEFKTVKIESCVEGIIIKADAIGSLEALTELFKNAKVPIRKTDIGPVTRKDVMDASTNCEENKLYKAIISFNVEIDEGAEEETKLREVKLFSGNVVYKLIEDYTKWTEEIKNAEKKDALSKLVTPVEFEVMQGHIFRNNKPAIFGAKIIEGKLREGWKVMNKKGEFIGTIEGMQDKGERFKEAKKGMELAVSVKGGNIGRNLFEGDHLFSILPLSQTKELFKFMDELTEEEKDLLKKIHTIKIQNEEEEVV
jgi:translation initiation factor 5B